MSEAEAEAARAAEAEKEIEAARAEAARQIAANKQAAVFERGQVPPCGF